MRRSKFAQGKTVSLPPNLTQTKVGQALVKTLGECGYNVPQPPTKLIVEIATFITVDVASIAQAKRVATQEFNSHRSSYPEASYIRTVHGGYTNPAKGLVPLEKIGK